MKNILISIFLLSFLFTACTQKRKVNEVANKIITYSKVKDFKNIYPLLSKKERESITLDSFYIENFRRYEELDSMGTLKLINSYVSKMSDDEYLFNQVVEIPDFSLIYKIKEEKENIKDLIKRMIKSNSLPYTIDTFKLKFVKENGEFKYSPGYYNRLRYLRILDSLKNDFFSKSVKINADKLVLKKYNYINVRFAELYATIKNISPCKIRSIYCDLKISGKIYQGRYSGSIFFSLNLESNEQKLDKAYILDEIKELLFVEYYPEKNIIKGDQIEILVKDIYFNDKCDDEKYKLYDIARIKSNVYDNSLDFIPIVAALSK